MAELSPAPPRPEHASLQAIVVSTLERVGWEIRDAEIDLGRDEVILSVHRFDGRWLYLRGSSGAVTVERFQRVSTVERRKHGPTIDAIRDDFLGRERCQGARAGLRHVCNYIASNPAPGFQALPRDAVRGAFHLLMNASEET